MDFFERWRAIGGSLLVSPPLIGQPVRCEEGGDDCGHDTVMRHPHDTQAPFLQALRRYWKGERSSLTFRATGASDAEKRFENQKKLCNPECVWGVCVPKPGAKGEGLCSCFDGYTGSACKVFSKHKNRDCHDTVAPVGMNLVALNDWSRQWDFLDVFKKSRFWVSQNFNTWEWDTHQPFPLTKNGFPAKLAANQRVTALLMRDLNQHHPNGNFTGR